MEHRPAIQIGVLSFTAEETGSVFPFPRGDAQEVSISVQGRGCHHVVTPVFPCTPTATQPLSSLLALALACILALAGGVLIVLLR